MKGSNGTARKKEDGRATGGGGEGQVNGKCSHVLKLDVVGVHFYSLSLHVVFTVLSSLLLSPSSQQKSPSDGSVIPPSLCGGRRAAPGKGGLA